jgi:hypothetical protein
MDDYDKEAIAITVDYLQMLAGNKIAEARRSNGAAESWPLGQTETATSRD